jgi:PAS domain S-box-containing protein
MSTGRQLSDRAQRGAPIIDCGHLTEVTRAAQESQPGRAEPRLAAILRFLPVVAFSLDSEGLITSVSEVGVDIVEASTADVVGRSVFELFSTARIGREIRRALAGYQVTGIHPGGEGRYFHTRLDPMFDPYGNITGIMGVSVDVTDAWLDKRELRQLRQEHRRRVERGRLLDRVMRAREEERRRTAGDLHDAVQELLGAAATASRITGDFD